MKITSLRRVLVATGLSLLLLGQAYGATPAHHSPASLVASPDGKTLYATDATAGVVVILDTAKKSKRAEIALKGQPRSMTLSSDGSTLYVAEYGAGSVAIIDTAKAAVTGRVATTKWPNALAIGNQTQRLYVGNQDQHTVSAFDLSKTPPLLVGQVAVSREPNSFAISPDESRVVVANLLASGVGTDPTLSAEVSIIETATLDVSAAIKLPPGSTLVRGVCMSPDGKYAYAVHGLGRFNLPITQLERGWVNTFALTIIDVAKAERVATMLLDDLTQGAADPHSVVVSKQGDQMWISHTGVHEVSMIDIGLVHELLKGNVPDELASLRDGSQANIWVRISQDAELISDLENDLTALYIAGAIRRAKTGGKGPQGIALSTDGATLYAANYYAGTVAVLDAASGRLQGSIAVGEEVESDPVRRGEIIFHDATRAFQRWHSCSSCHPNQGRVDGLRWDFLGDGIGNAKDTMNLLNFNETEPLNRRATVATAYECTKNGLAGTHMIVPTKDTVDDLYAYLSSFKVRPSHHLTDDGKLTESGQRGKALFEGKARCVRCHPGPYYTDKKMHAVGVRSSNEPDGRYDTPSLVEAFRTAPYLHDGRAASIPEVLTKFNEKNQHGRTRDLSKQELDDLATYILSL